MYTKKAAREDSVRIMSSGLQIRVWIARGSSRVGRLRGGRVKVIGLLVRD